MLTISDTHPDRTCQGFARRDFLKIGALGMAGAVGLPGLLQAAAAHRPGFLRDKAVVLLFLQGGPSHIECFDPKMSAPVEIHSITGEVPTKLPGVTFGGTFPKMAAIADKLAVVRSYGSGNAGHSYEKVASGNNPTKAAMSAIYARVAGTNRLDTGMPTNTLILPEAINPEIQIGSNFETNALPTLTAAGDLGNTFAAFNPAGGGTVKSNMELRIPRERLADRQYLLGRLDSLRRRVDAEGVIEGVDTYQQQAFDVITGGVARAFDLSQEDPKTIERYDTRHIFRQADVQRWGDMRRSSNLLGHQMLLARRLCEAGCGFVTVSDCGWDMHSNGNSPKHLGGMYWLGPQTDHAVSAFVEDIHARGLADKIMLIVTGEMGRTPRINKNGGRDHYGELTPLVFAGGGLQTGQVIGESDGHATKAKTDPYRPEHLMATVMHSLFNLGELRLERGMPRELLRAVEAGEPIPGLL